MFCSIIEVEVEIPVEMSVCSDFYQIACVALRMHKGAVVCMHLHRV